MSKKQPVKQPETGDIVKLKPLLGIRPGVYLTVLYSGILLLILFLLLIRPGIKNNGSLLIVKTEPDGAAIRINGVYMGSSKDRIFVPKGRCTLEAVLPGFEPKTLEVEIKGRLFGSLLFPRKHNISLTLETNDAVNAFTLAASEYAAWSFGGEPTAAWQIPLSLSDGAYRIGRELTSHGDSKTRREEAEEILLAAARFASTRAGVRDLIRAKFLLDSGGVSPSPAGLSYSASDILRFLSENPESAEWLANLLPPESAAIVKASDWYRNAADTVFFKPRHGVYSKWPQEPAGLTFTRITYLSEDADYEFNICDTPVPRSLYERFLNDNPSWKNEEDLFPAEISGAPEITGVSWFAAEAFCKWLAGRLPASIAGSMEVRLPTEKEWEIAAHAERTGIVVKEALWEWCADPFSHLPFIKTSPKAAEAAGSPERALRSMETRASLPPEFSSPFVTFRPVIAARGN